MILWFKLIKDSFLLILLCWRKMDYSHKSKQIAPILGCPSLAVAGATINCRLGLTDFSVMNMNVRLDMFKAACQPAFEDECEYFLIDVIDEMIRSFTYYFMQ